MANKLLLLEKPKNPITTYLKKEERTIRFFTLASPWGQIAAIMSYKDKQTII
jgi:hypothetical protein